MKEYLFRRTICILQRDAIYWKYKYRSFWKQHKSRYYRKFYSTSESAISIICATSLRLMLFSQWLIWSKYMYYMYSIYRTNGDLLTMIASHMLRKMSHGMWRRIILRRGNTLWCTEQLTRDICHTSWSAKCVILSEYWIVWGIICSLRSVVSSTETIQQFLREKQNRVHLV